MAHTMDALEEWEIIQAGINQDYYSVASINDTSLGVEKLNITSENSLTLHHYKEPEQLRDQRLLLPDSEHESSETEGDAIVSYQERNSVGEEETGKKKPLPAVWWKSFLDNLFKSFSAVGLSYCKPFWCMSVLATMVSFVVLKKRIFGTTYKQRTVTTSRKKETQFAASIVQLNQTLSAVRRIPVINILPQAVDANPWAIVHIK